MAAVPSGADMIPRLYGSTSAIFADHGYSEGLEYSAAHFAETGLPVLFVGMPISVEGVVSRTSTQGNTGSSVPSVVASAGGFYAEHDGVLYVVAGGTIGTDQIRLNLSLDGGKTFKAIRLGIANSFTLPNVNGTVSFGAGTLVTGDTILTWHGSGPLPATSDLATVRANLAARQFLFRDALLCGDLQVVSDANNVVTQANAYATEDKRNVDISCSVFDRLPQAAMSQVLVRMTGAPSLTFAEVGATGDTITRAAGSFLADGFVSGDTVTVTGSSSNNVSGPAPTITGTVITFGTTDLVAEITSGATVVGSPTLTFDSVGHTVTRSRGSWLTDGFRVGDSVTFVGTASNNVTKTITVLTATVMTFASGLVDESIASNLVTATAGETLSAWMTRADSQFASVDAQPRIHLGAGRATFPSPYSGWQRRVPSIWLDNVICYQHDIHVASWRKDFGSIGGASLEDADGNTVEWDDRVNGGAGSAARFTTLRTWSNGPQGVFVALSLTRAGDGQLASLRPNQAVINDVCNTVQLATENAIGRSVPLNANGTATADFLKALAAEVNAALELEILSSRGEGARASACTWAPSPSDVYNVPEPITNGTVSLTLNGITHTFDTRVVTRANGQ